MSRTLRNVKHVGSINDIQSGIDTYMKSVGNRHHAADTRNAPTTKLRFNPSRTSNPQVALEWEARVQELHAETRIFHKKSRTFDHMEHAKLLEMAYYFNKYGAPF